MDRNTWLANGLERFSSILKILSIGILILLFLIPLNLIRLIIQERESSRSSAENEVMHMWGGEQTIAGPILTVPYIGRRRDAQGRIEEVTDLAHFLPETLQIDGRIEPQTRRRGIYEVTLYTADLHVQGRFAQPDLAGWRVAAEDILWEDAYLSVGMADMRALQERIGLSWQGESERILMFEAAKADLDLFQGEIRTGLPGLAHGRSEDRYAYAFDVVLKGGRSLYFLPLGDETRVRLDSVWDSPSFDGSFLPSHRRIDESGFEAEWRVISLARSYPRQWREKEIGGEDLLASRFGVNLMIPVDTYLKVTRAIKYGVLFIILPFLTFFLFEVFIARKVHFFQYLLVGLAVCIFYLLLLSLSEHVAFLPAYVAASTATTILITFYSCAVLHGWRRGIVLAPVLASAYTFLFVVLRSEDYALLLGSCGLFAILAVVMVITRKLDWYDLGRAAKTEHAGTGN